jgi:hypothetical protein
MPHGSYGPTTQLQQASNGLGCPLPPTSQVVGTYNAYIETHDTSTGRDLYTVSMVVLQCLQVVQLITISRPNRSPVTDLGYRRD